MTDSSPIDFLAILSRIESKIDSNMDTMTKKMNSITQEIVELRGQFAEQIIRQNSTSRFEKSMKPWVARSIIGLSRLIIEKKVYARTTTPVSPNSFEAIPDPRQQIINGEKAVSKLIELINEEDLLGSLQERLMTINHEYFNGIQHALNIYKTILAGPLSRSEKNKKFFDLLSEDTGFGLSVLSSYIFTDGTLLPEVEFDGRGSVSHYTDSQERKCLDITISEFKYKGSGALITEAIEQLVKRAAMFQQIIKWIYPSETQSRIYLDVYFVGHSQYFGNTQEKVKTVLDKCVRKSLQDDMYLIPRLFPTHP